MSLIKSEKIEKSTELGLIAFRSLKREILGYLLKSIVVY